MHLFQLATGLNRWSKEQQAWVPASAAIEIVNGKGLVRNAQWSAIISGNANDPAGSLDLLTPDEVRVVIQTIGLAYTDDTGKSIFIAELKDSAGQLVDDHTVLFPNAIEGEGVSADIRVRTSLGGIENDIILRKALPDPALFGMDPARTRIEAWHEVLNRAKPSVRQGSIRRSPDFFDPDSEVHFGSMLIGRGNAFSLGASDLGNGVVPLDQAVAVSKEFAEINQMSFLIEKIPYSEAQPFLAHLPKPVQALNIDRAKVERAFAAVEKSKSGERMRPVTFAADDRKRPVSPVQSGGRKGATAIAASYRESGGITRNSLSAENKPGFLIDFSSVVTATNFTFEGTTTYYVSGDVTLSGDTVIEGGSVTKFSNNAPTITITGTLLCKTTPWLPAVFTAKDADEAGDTITGSSGSPSGTYALRPLKFANADALATCAMHDLRIAFAQYGATLYCGFDNDVRNVQMVRCKTGVELAYAYARVRNVLVQGADNYVLYGNNSKFTVEHLTAHTAGNLYYNNVSSFYITNSLLVAVTNIGSYTGGYNQEVNSDAGVFTSVLQGAHYLATETYRNAGTTNVSDLSEIRKLTTYAPVLMTGTVSVPTILNPIVLRDTDVPDLGYHYPPIDVIVSNVTLSASVTCTNGFKLGYCGINGFRFNGGAFVSEGKPDDLNRICRTETIQEQPFGIASSDCFIESPSSFVLNFVGASSLASTDSKRTLVKNMGGAFTFSLNHCLLSGIFLASTNQFGSSTCYWVNDIFERCGLYLEHSNARGSYPYVYAYNNLFVGGATTFVADTAAPWTFRDNVFYQKTFNVWFFGGSATAYYNAYHAGFSSLGGSGNITLYNVDFVPGPLGPYYYPNTGTNLHSLINAGSSTANGTLPALYHFTVLQDETKETNGVVDIGAHYPAASNPKVRFVGTDDSTQGNWPGVYGSGGYAIIQYTTRFAPDFHQTFTGASGWVWDSNPTDVRAPMRGDGTGRKAGVVFSGTSFDLNITQDEGTPRRVGIYCVDYDYGGRTQTIEVRDSVTGTVYDTRTASSFSGGRYYIWEIVGAVTIRLTTVAGPNAVLSAIFLDPGGAVTAADQDGDGMADVFEDRNGNGSVDSGETSWMSGTDPGLKIIVTEPKSNSVIP